MDGMTLLTLNQRSFGSRDSYMIAYKLLRGAFLASGATLISISVIGALLPIEGGAIVVGQYTVTDSMFQITMFMLGGIMVGGAFGCNRLAEPEDPPGGPGDV
jgi:hypothetical protein